MLNSVTAVAAAETSPEIKNTTNATESSGRFSDIFQNTAKEASTTTAGVNDAEFADTASGNNDTIEVLSGSAENEAHDLLKILEAEESTETVESSEDMALDGMDEINPLLNLLRQSRDISKSENKQILYGEAAKSEQTVALSVLQQSRLKDNLLTQTKNEATSDVGGMGFSAKAKNGDFSAELDDLNLDGSAKKEWSGLDSELKLKSDNNEKSLDLKPLLDQMKSAADAIKLSASSAAVTGDLSLEGAGLYSQPSSVTASSQALSSQSSVEGSPLQMHAEPKAIASQLNDKIMVMMARNMQQADIEIHPSELGPLRIRVEMDGDQASLHFTAPHMATKEVLDQALPRLRELFDRQQLNLGEVNVDSGQAGHTGENTDNDAYSGGDGSSESQQIVSTDDLQDQDGWQEVEIAPADNGLDFYA
ncbi:flagellar hook-length control protein FliK [Pelagibaculum spongiae]|uniref:Flagellar hook-length control protein-like C-terminal domain-containing protein n=1 Tax=Pelagibaculum spongiae TaxID=2080658 RepID=A0A2V1GQZ6_9GAMM|nr:flagellar hook-length control protein FliK [Pelagibaculum spongiae]PVZ66719.1 hypothetical protein DC094_15735 [Pelagibaculum spongiae]